mgnify:CR=1 FL=1
MGRVNYTPEQIISRLRKVEVLCSQGQTIGEAVRQIGVSEQTYYRWRKQYGGMSTADVKRLKELEKENARLKRLVADLSLDNAIWKDINEGKAMSPAKRRMLVEKVRKAYHLSERRACRALKLNPLMCQIQAGQAC